MAAASELKAALIAGFPPGVDSVVDWNDAPGRHMEAVAQTLTKATDLVDTMATEISPLTVIQKLPEWERLLRLKGNGSTAQRQAALVSRLRELGQVTTRPMVQSVIAPLLGYADPSELVVIEADRAAQRAAHTYAWTGSKSFSLMAAIIPWRVLDDAKVSPAGAQVDVTITHSDISKIAATLTGPDGATATVGIGKLGRGSVSGATLRLYFPSLAGAKVGGIFGGNWSLSIGATSGTGTITAADLFVEGLHLDSARHDGLGAAVYRWGVMVEDDKLGPTADLIAAREALERIRYACRPPALLRRSVGSGALAAGDFAVIPGDPNSIPKGALPG